jgi:hypothetical protein
MPLTKLQFRPGINREITSYSNEGGWFDGDKIRFRASFPEKINGWQRLGNSTFLGTCRGLHLWRTLGLETYLGVGTHLKYYIEYGQGYYDVTPIRRTTSAGAVTFVATDGSSVLTVTDGTHGAVAGDFVTYTDAVTLGGDITAAVLNQEYQIASVTDSSTYTIIARAVASLSAITIDGEYTPTPVVANASDTGDGGAGVIGAYQINIGLDTSVFGTGWGAGPWSRGSWGSAATIDLIKDTLRLWTHDNFGEDLLFNVHNGGIYYWDSSGGLSNNRGVAISDIAGSDLAPTIATQIMVSDVDRHVIAFGCDPLDNIGVQDPLLIRFSEPRIADRLATHGDQHGWRLAHRIGVQDCTRSRNTPADDYLYRHVAACNAVTLDPRSRLESKRFPRTSRSRAPTLRWLWTTASSGWAARSSTSTRVRSTGCRAPCATTCLTTSTSTKPRRPLLRPTRPTARSGGSTRRSIAQRTTATSSTTTLSRLGTTAHWQEQLGLTVAWSSCPSRRAQTTVCTSTRLALTTAALCRPRRSSFCAVQPDRPWRRRAVRVHAPHAS